MLDTILVINAHLKNVNCVHNMKNKKYTVATIRGRQNRKHLKNEYMVAHFALHMKRGCLKIKTVLIIVYFIGNPSFNNGYTCFPLSSDS